MTCFFFFFFGSAFAGKPPPSYPSVIPSCPSSSTSGSSSCSRWRKGCLPKSPTKSFTCKDFAVLCGRAPKRFNRPSFGKENPKDDQGSVEHSRPVENTFLYTRILLPKEGHQKKHEAFKKKQTKRPLISPKSPNTPIKPHKSIGKPHEPCKNHLKPPCQQHETIKIMIEGGGPTNLKPEPLPPKSPALVAHWWAPHAPTRRGSVEDSNPKPPIPEGAKPLGIQIPSKKIVWGGFEGQMQLINCELLLLPKANNAVSLPSPEFLPLLAHPELASLTQKI